MNRKDLGVKLNGRSADFIIPSFSVGCSINCLYCYAKRHREDNMIIYDNLDDIANSVIRYSRLLEAKVPNQCGDEWTFDIGESSDILQYQVIPYSNYTIDKILEGSKELKLTFATKLCHPKNISKIDYRGNRLRIRSSLSPSFLINKLERKTCLLEDRIKGMNEAINYGWEVHVNFSPVVIYENWIKDYYDLFDRLDRELDQKVKEQLKAEVIFLTHHPKLHEKNLSNSLRDSESYLWTPHLQETKVNNRGDQVLRYKAWYKKKCIEAFKKMLEDRMPYCKIRYIF